MPQKKKGSSVRIYNLVKSYGNVLAVNDVSLEIEPGEFVTLLGPSGSGKTTTLMMIAGFEIPNGGEIFIDDELINFKPPYKRGLGMVFQHYSLFPHMTVERNIGFPMRMRKFDKRETIRKVREILELVKLTSYENRFPRQLSGGQQQRVALARALVFNPQVLLMDEPLGALDKKLREHMQLEIKQITQMLNISVIYVTHDQIEAMTMSDRIAVMNNGKIEQIGSPTEIYETPENYFVAGFIGESNFIKGRVEKVDHQSCYFISESRLSFKSFTNQKKQRGIIGDLVIRPEKISFVEKEQSLQNHFEAIVEKIIYLGDNTIYTVKLVQDGTELMIKQQNKFIAHQISENEKVYVGWNEKDSCIVY